MTAREELNQVRQEIALLFRATPETITPTERTQRLSVLYNREASLILPAADEVISAPRVLQRIGYRKKGDKHGSNAAPGMVEGPPPVGVVHKPDGARSRRPQHHARRGKRRLKP